MPVRVENSIKEELSDWMRDEPDENYRNTLAGIIAGIDSGDTKSGAQAIELFGSKLSFGTAGLRGLMRPGPNGINRQTVCKTTLGLAHYLLARESRFPKGLTSVVIGHDARERSAVFARDAAEVLSAQGIRALLFPNPIPTPLVAYATKKLGARAGIMITASHNAAEYNGYKVFEGGGAQGSQFLPEDAQEIANLCETVSKPVRWASIPRNSQNLLWLDETIFDAYLDTLCEFLGSGTSDLRPANVLYTPLHGVGGYFFLRASSKCGFPEPKVVEAQFEPDEGFPTISSPNPELEDSFALSFARASAEDFDAIIAHDGDADRLGVAVKDKSLAAGFRCLTGNELGVILAWHLLSRLPDSNRELCVAYSVVSSPILAKIAQHFGVRSQQTPPGFKFLSRVENLVFAYEEALGFLVIPAALRDKDGISAALLFLDLLHSLKARNETVDDLLIKIGKDVGGFASSQLRINVGDSTSAELAMAQLRTMDPDSIRNASVDRIEDFMRPHSNFPSLNLIQFHWNDGLRLTFRPSGTEPILKVYMDVLAEDMPRAKALLGRIQGNIKGQILPILTNSQN